MCFLHSTQDARKPDSVRHNHKRYITSTAVGTGHKLLKDNLSASSVLSS